MEEGHPYTAGHPEFTGLAPRLSRALALLAGLFLTVVFFALDQTQVSITWTIVDRFNFSAPGESYFWLAHAVLLVPAGLLIGWAVAPWLAPRLGAAASRLDVMDRRERLMGVGLVGLLGMLLARFGRGFFLFDHAVTDDELAVQFGGQVLASGQTTADPLPLYEYMPRLFDFFDGERVASMDWPGGQIAMAISELGAGPWLHALLAAVPLMALAVFFARRFSVRWGALAAALFALSPMAFALSMTMHAHLVSRAFLAIGMACFGLGLLRRDMSRGSSANADGDAAAGVENPPRASDSNRDRWLWFAAGFAFAAAVASRPFESASLGAPLVLWLLWNAARHKEMRKPLLYFVLGGVLPLLVFGLINAALTGKPWVPARWSGFGLGNSGLAKGGKIPDSMYLFWDRFGANLGYNLFMLSVWFLGPLGILLVALGVTRNRLARLLGLGVVCNLLVAMAHDNHGVHHVGPIHYSEAAVPLTFIAVFGVLRIREICGRLRVGFGQTLAAGVVVLALGLGIFNIWNGLALRRSAVIHATIYDVVEDPEVPESVVLVPPYVSLWRSFPHFAEAGGWVIQWRHNRPDGSDKQLLIYDVPGVAHLAAEAYPDRALLRLMRVDESPGLALMPVDLSREPNITPQPIDIR